MSEIFKEESLHLFLDTIFRELERSAIKVDHLEMDHLCYRVQSMKRYDEIKTHLTNEYQLLSESLVNGRPIMNFQLIPPLTYQERKIAILEIPAPKHGSKYEEGFEHVEFVIQKSIEEFLEEYKHIPFDLKGLNKPYNREVRVKFDQYSVKFHESSLVEVIRKEKEAKRTKLPDQL
ncbi:VOC family protein [Portibacter marinus]|uniref:VOC family protein n=1 Tax=Portibacter marinus TaxID=2898660 RepID=UPI001F44141C|nr:VOC family protein [Portibacter marinus]